MSAHLDPGWGSDYGNSEQAYITSERVARPVWMYRKGQRVRFFDQRGEQVGPEHSNVAPAVVWAAFNGWIDPAHPDLSVACIAEVRANVTVR